MHQCFTPGEMWADEKEVMFKEMYKPKILANQRFGSFLTVN